MAALRDREWIINARQAIGYTRQALCDAIHDVSGIEVPESRIFRIERSNVWFTEQEFYATAAALLIDIETAQMLEKEWRSGIKNPLERTSYNVRHPIYGLDESAR